jgi:hypothetical protein
MKSRPEWSKLSSAQSSTATPCAGSPYQLLRSNGTARKCCWRSRTWVERLPRLGVPFSTVWSIAAYVVLVSSFLGRCAGAGKGNRRGLGRRAGSEVYGPQAQELTRPRARAPARRDHRRLHRQPEEIAARRKAFIRKWRLRHRAVADSLEEAGDRLFTFTRLPPTQWRSTRTTNAIERLHEEFKRRIKTQTVLPSADTAAMLFWALLASGQINMRKVDGWQTLATNPINQQIDLAA